MKNSNAQKGIQIIWKAKGHWERRAEKCCINTNF